jgi:hypothetical protein
MVNSCYGCGFCLQNERLTRSEKKAPKAPLAHLVQPRSLGEVRFSGLAKREAGSFGLAPYRLVAVK